MSVVEDDSEAEEQDGSFKRSNWTKVARLRRADKDALERQNAASRASMRLGPEAALSTCVSIFPQDQSDQGTWHFADGRGWRRRVRRLKPIEEAYFDPTHDDCCYQLTLMFSTTQQAKQARDRILARTEEISAAWRDGVEGDATQAGGASRPPAADTATAATSSAAAAAGIAATSQVPMSKHDFGQRLHLRVALVDVAQAGKITGMLLELPDETLRYLLIDENALQEQINDAVQVLHQAGVDGRDEAAGAGAAADAAAAAATGAGANPAAGEAASAVDVHAAAAAVRGVTKSPRGQ